MIIAYRVLLSSRESPRALWRDVRPDASAVADSNSLHQIPQQIHTHTGRRFGDQRRGCSPIEKHLPFAEIRGLGMKIEPRKHKNARKAVLALPLLVATPARRRCLGHSSSLAFLVAARTISRKGAVCEGKSWASPCGFSQVIFCKRVIQRRGGAQSRFVLAMQALNRLIS